MQQMNHIQQLIIGAVTNSNNNQLRKQAEAIIFNLSSQNPTQFFQNCTFLITDSTRADVNRQAVASVMKALLQKKNDKDQFFWDLVEQSRRLDIKTSLLNNLVSENKVVMRAGANVIAGIVAIQNSRGQWLDLIHLLAANTRHQSHNIRAASITTLGYICEDIKNSQTKFPLSACEQMLGGIINGLRQIEQIAQISLQALRDSVHFLALILENYNYMNETFNALYSLLSNDLGSKAYEVLFEMGKVCYLLLSPFLQRLCQITIEHIRYRSAISQRAMQFWDIVATQYLTRSEKNSATLYISINPVPNYIMQIQSVIVPQIMSCMLIGNNADLEHPELREASVRSLTSIVGCCGMQIVDLIVGGVENIIDTSQEGNRQASVLLFSCLSQHKDRKLIKCTFYDWFQRLYSLINDSSQIVRKNTLNGFVELSFAFPVVFIQQEKQNDIFQCLLLLSQHQDDVISELSLQILFNITRYFYSNRKNNKPFNKSQLYIQLLLSKIVDENSHKSIKCRQMIVQTTINMLFLITDYQPQAELLKYLFNQYYAIDQKKAFMKTNILQIISQLLLISRNNQYLLDQMIENINQFVQHLFQTMGCSIGVFKVVGSLSLSMSKSFSRINLDQNYWKYTYQGLNSYEDTKLFQATILCLCDIVRCHNRKYTSKIIALTKHLIGFIHSNICNNHKIFILRYISDICIGLGEYAKTFLDKILAICTECFNAVYILQQSEDQRDYADDLKYAIIEMYVSFNLMIHEKGKVNLKLAHHFETFSTFIVLTCQQRQNPQLEYLRQSIMALFDCALIYLKNKIVAPTVRNIINSEEVKMIIGTLKLHSNRQDIQDTLRAVAIVYSKIL